MCVWHFPVFKQWYLDSQAVSCPPLYYGLPLLTHENKFLTFLYGTGNLTVNFYWYVNMARCN
jgi:hypothetical protein